MIESSTDKFFPRKPVCDDDMIYDEEPCPVCKEPISEHDSKSAFECALAIVKGGKND